MDPDKQDRARASNRPEHFSKGTVRFYFDRKPFHQIRRTLCFTNRFNASALPPVSQ